MKNNPDRPRSVEEINDITDSQYLYDIALGETDYSIQKAAVQKLNGIKDTELIGVYEWRKWTYDESDEPAVDEYWYGSDRYKDFPSVRKSAVEALTNQSILKKIVCKDPNHYVRMAALQKITDIIFLNALRKYDRVTEYMQNEGAERLCEVLNIPAFSLDEVMSEEYLNVYDELRRPVGIMPRSIVHRDGLWHETFHCWFMQRECIEGKDTAYLWFQQRSASKKDYPNLLDITAAGHLGYQEEPGDGVREIQEELGLGVAFEDLRPLGIRINIGRTAVLTDNEFNHVYLYDCPDGMDRIRFKDGEVQGIFRISAEDGIKLFSDKEEQIIAAGYVRVGDKLAATSLPVDIGCFVPRPVGGYYLKMCIIADLAAKGYPYLAI